MTRPTYFMRDMRQRIGPHWFRLSGEELMWLCAACVAGGLLLGLLITLGAFSLGAIK